MNAAAILVPLLSGASVIAIYVILRSFVSGPADASERPQPR